MDIDEKGSVDRVGSLIWAWFSEVFSTSGRLHPVVFFFFSGYETFVYAPTTHTG